ncbi:MAG: translocation/assembly module TamB [marine benthic group bacterium]|jgi:autotransporter translocation and assembly factor TamB|nr:translocation/assembly module TamB [Gemmatimonadota bacterium]MCL7973358.1 translocation/assembly module TamB [Gemmatimonadota bacterium]MCL7982921.1 translocation/assembly module TamB [Gemmatimonadota bacterium]MCL7983660.1 translocation/assembly module TamB [Gemmatimonadota bacterium]MCL7989677.1 translocation/assembly module TamB [Gemmatimonadota bacterium]
MANKALSAVSRAAGRLAGSLTRVALGLVGIAFLTAAGSLLLLSQTVVGRQAVADLVVDALEGTVNGGVRIGPILGGNLFTHALVERFEITDPDGRLFVGIDSVRLHYNPLSLALGTFRFDDVSMERVRLVLRQHEDGRWNFDRIFGDEEPAEPDTIDDGRQGNDRILLSDVLVREGEVEVHVPWATGLTGAARDSAVAQGLRGDRLWRVRTTGPDRYERELLLHRLSGRFPLIRIVDPVRPLRFDMEGVSAEAEVVTQTLDVVSLDGSVEISDTVDIRLDAIELAESALSGSGWVHPVDPVQFDFDLEARDVGFADLQWIPLPVPARGGGPADLHLFTRGETIVVEARNGDIRVDDSRVRGDFTAALETVPRFERLDVDLQPLRLALVNEVLEIEEGPDGFLEGPVEGSGPITLLTVDAELTIRDPPSTEEAAPSFLGARGGIAIVEPRRMSELDLTLRSFEPRWAGIVGLDNELPGRATGSATFDGIAGGRFRFDTEISHTLPEHKPSVLAGGGMVDLEGDREVDVAFEFDPLVLAIVEPVLPEGVSVLSEVRGPFSARGPLDDLKIETDLGTPRGQLSFTGQFDLVSELQSYDATLLARDIQLSEWIESGPATRLAVEGRVSGTGTDPATLEAQFDLRLLPSLFEGARVDTSIIRFTLADGLARADTFAIRSQAGAVDGRGAFGLTENTSGSLVLDIAIPDLSEWNAWTVEGRNPARIEDDVTELFEAFAPTDEGPVPETLEALPDTLSGSLEALGVLYGNVADFSFGGRAFARDLAWGEIRTDSIQVTLDLPDPTDPDSLVAHGSAFAASIYGRTLDTLDVRWTRHTAESHEVSFYARRDSTLEVDSSNGILWTDRQKAFRLDRLHLVGAGRSLTLADTALITYGETGLTARGVRLDGADGTFLELEGAIPDSGQAALDLTARSLHLENFLEAPGNPLGLRGTIDIDVQVRGTADAPLAELDATIDAPSIRGIGYERLTTDLSYAGRRLAVNSALVTNDTEIARVDGFLRVDLSFRDVERRVLDEPIDLMVVVDSMPLTAVELRVESLRDVQGYALGSFRVTGKPGELRFDGETRFHDAAATVPSLGIRLRDAIGRLVFAGADARVDTLSVRSSAGGTAVVAGHVGVRDPTDITFDLAFSADRFVGMDRRTMRTTIDGAGTLQGSYTRPEVAGDFRVSRGEVQAERFVRERQVVDLTDPSVYALLDTVIVRDQRILGRIDNPFMQNLKLDVNLAVGPDFWLRSSALDVELSGDIELHMDRARGDLTALGTLNLPRGKFRYVSGTGTDLSSLYSRQLQIDRGAITFVGTPGLDPNLDIDAEYRARGEIGQVTIRVHVGGSALSPTMTTSSDPPLPESDRICYLLFSSACFGASNQGGQFATSLVREGLLGSVSSQVSQVLVGGVGLVDYVDIRSSGATERELETGQSNLLYGTEIEIGRYLTPDLFVKVTQPLGGRLPGMTVDWAFLPSWRLEFRTEDRFNRYASYGYSFSTYSDRTWGFLLFREWAF